MISRRRDLYALGRVAGTTGTALVLDLRPMDTQDAKQLLSWQRQGCPGYDWFICTRSGPSTFQTGAGEAVEAHQSPYTDASWERFLKSWGA